MTHARAGVRPLRHACRHKSNATRYEGYEPRRLRSYGVAIKYTHITDPLADARAIFTLS